MIPFPVFTIVPDFTAPPRYSVAHTTDVVRHAAAPAIALYPDTEPTHVFSFGFKLTTRIECETLKAFFRARGGRCHPFYLPSWRDDLSLVSATTDTITVTDPGTADGHGDSYARTLFIWQGDDLHVTRWTTKTDNGATWTYRLEQPLTFTPTAGKAMVGFAHLVRFSDDRLRYRHRLPEVADGIEIGFRAPRQWSGIEELVAMTPTTVGQHPGFDAGDIEANALTPIEHRVSYALGPAVLGTPATPATRWACWQGSDGRPRLKIEAGTITLPDGTGAASALFPTSVTLDRLSLAFDHTGSETIAYADTTAGSIEIRWYDGGAQSEAWTGYDPLLAYNYFANTGMGSGDREVLCYYLKEGKNQLFVRRGIEGFATEYVAATLPVKPLELRGLASNHYDLLIADANWRLCTLTAAV